MNNATRDGLISQLIGKISSKFPTEAQDRILREALDSDSHPFWADMNGHFRPDMSAVWATVSLPINYDRPSDEVVRAGQYPRLLDGNCRLCDHIAAESGDYFLQVRAKSTGVKHMEFALCRFSRASVEQWWVNREIHKIGYEPAIIHDLIYFGEALAQERFQPEWGEYYFVATGTGYSTGFVWASPYIKLNKDEKVLSDFSHPFTTHCGKAMFLGVKEIS